MLLANTEKKFINSLLRSNITDSCFLSELLPLHSISIEKQLSIYRSNINGAHQKVLAQIYPACLNVLGEDYFNQLCRLYRFEYPSIDADLNNYGGSFSAFIQKQLGLRVELSQMGYLPDLANLEWCWHAAYFANNDEVFSFEKLASVNENDQNKIFFNLSDSFSIHSTTYPLLAIWSANKSTVEDVQEFIMPDSKSYFCVFRKEFFPVVDLLEYEQYVLLKSIVEGISLVQLIEFDEVVEFKNKFVEFIQRGWVTGFFIQD